MLNFISKYKLKNNAPDFITSYLNLFNSNIDRQKRISDSEFVIFDIESSGLSTRKDFILSIGAVKLKNYKIDIFSSFEVYINRDVENKESISIHGILANGKEEKVDEIFALESFLKYIGNNILVGHNVDFDVAMINKSLKTIGGIKLKNKTLDTRNLYLRVKGGMHFPGKSLSLDAMCDEFGITKSDRHTAPGDAFITAVLFMKLLKRLEKRGVKTLNELLYDHKKLF